MTITIGNIFKQCRILNDMSISEASEISGLNPNLISKIESDKSKISLETIEKLSKTYQIRISDIFKVYEETQKCHLMVQEIFFKLSLAWLEENKNN